MKAAEGYLRRQYLCLLRRCAWNDAFGAFIAAMAAIHGVTASAQSIVTDGRTQTQLSVNGSVTDVTTRTVRGANAFNSFSRFNVDTANTVNLHLPGQTSNLLNLIQGEQSNINGLVNAYKGGQIGGNIFFLNPHGIVVGAGGVLNVGSLTMVTPTTQFMDSLIDPSGLINDAAVGNVLTGYIPLTDTGLIQVKGRINAANAVTLTAGQVAVDSGAHVVAGPQAMVSFADLVNIQNVAVGSAVEVTSGIVRITAAGNADIAGQVSSDGADGIGAGMVDIHAGTDIHLTNGAVVSASGQGIASSGGNVKIYADGSATLETGARVSANGGISGDGGFVEFSATNTVNIFGGSLEAGSRSGVAGTILIDPTDVSWTGADVLKTGIANDFYTGGANIIIDATNSIHLTDVTISSRYVDPLNNNRTNIATASSIGNSGNITLKAPKIKLDGGTALLANDDRIGAGATTGIVTLEATDSSVLPTLGWATATAQIDIDAATIKGNKVMISAKSNIDSQFVYSSEDPVDSALNVATTTAQQIGGFLASLGGVELVVSDVNAKAYVNINSGANIESATSVTISAENVTKAGMAKQLPSPGAQFNTPLGIGALWVRDQSDAQVIVNSGATIKSADLSVLAHNNASLEASIASGKNQTENSDFTAIAVAITKADVQATATVNSGANLQISGNLTVAATNVGSYSNEVASVTGPNGRAAAAVAYADHQSGVSASLNAKVGDATQVNVLAINDVLKDEAVALSKVGGSQITSIIEDGKEKVASFKNAESVFWNALGFDVLKPDNKSSPTQQSFRIGGAIAFDTSTHTALAQIGDGTVVHATDSVSVLSRIRAEEMKIAAQSAAISTSANKPAANDTARSAYSVGLAIGNYTHDAVSRVGVDADVTASKIAVYSDTIIPIRASLLFGSKDATDNWTRWDGLENIMGAINSITNIFDVFNGISSAKSTSDGSDGSINLSGSVSILNYTDKSRAILDKGAQLNISGNQSGAWSKSIQVQPEIKNYDKLTGSILLSTDKAVKEDFTFTAPVSLQAKHDATLLFQAGEILPAGSGEKGLGVAFDQVSITSVTEAIVREGAVIKGVDETAGNQALGSRVWTQSASRAASNVDISAVSNERIISLAVSGGYGATFGANGTYSQMSLNNTTHALVDDEATVNAKTFNVSATASPVLWSLSGGINMSKNASVGVGIAINDVIGNTRAEVADNDTWSTDGKVRSSLVTVTDAKITSSDVNVTAKTGGHIEAIAVTGAIANNAPNAPGEEGLADKIKSKLGYTYLITKAEGLASTQKSFAKKIGASGAAQEKESEPPSYSFAGAGSGAINVSEILTAAKIEGVDIDQISTAAASLIVRAISDSDITAASGAAAITRANDASATKTIGVAGSVAVNSIGNGTEAWLKDTTVVNAGDVTVQALSGGEQLAVALGMAVDASKGPSVTKSDSFVGSLSLTLAQTDDNGDSKNKTIAKIDHSTITGDIAKTDRNLDVTAYNRTFIGTGGGSLSVQAGAAKSGTSIGAAVSWANVRNDVISGIYNDSTITQVDTVSVHAYNATEIGAGAAIVALSKAEGANSFAGSMVYNQITNTTRAAIEKSTVKATHLVDVQAKDKGADSTLEALIDPDGDRANVAKGLDYCGESAGATPSGNCIAAVAGTVQIGAGGNYGISIAYNQIENNLTAKIKDSAVTVTGTSAISDKINVIAESDTSILGVAFGAGVSADKFSGAGSVSIAGIENKVKAEIGQSAVGGKITTLTAPSVTISSTDSSEIQTLAGQVNVSFKASSAGAAFAYNEINNETRAIAETAAINASYMADILAKENANISSLSAAAGLAKGTSTSISASLNFIDNTTEARLSNSTIKDESGGTNLVKIKADDTSTIKSLSGSASIGSSNGVGAAFSLNQIGNTNKALAENSKIDGAHVFDLMAHQTATISALAGAFGAGSSGYSGSLTLNNIGQSFVGSSPSETTAELKNSTVSNGGGSFITIQGKDASTINSLAGALSIGEAGYGGAIADNNIQSAAKAIVSSSSLQDNDKLVVDGNNTSTIKSLSAAGAVGATGNAFAGSASSNRTENKIFGEIINSDITGSVAGGTSTVKVSATNTAVIEALSGAAAVSFSTTAVGIAISVNTINDTTEAHVTGKKAAGSAVKSLYVASASDATIKALSIGAAGAAGNAVAGSVAVNLIGSNTNAYIDGGAVVLAENNVGVTAVSDDRITVASGSAGISFGAAGVGVGFNVNSITSNTKAYIAGSDTRVTGLAKDSAAKMEVFSGTLTTAIKLADQIDITEFGNFDLKGKKATEVVTGVAVNASTSQSIENITATLGAGATGVGAAASVNVIGGSTQAYVSEAKINDINTSAGAGQKVAITASNIAYDNSFIVGVGVGGNAGGLGLDTHVVNRTTSAKATGGSIEAKNMVAVKARAIQGVSSVAAGAAIGGAAGAGTLSLALFNNTTEAIVDGTRVKASGLDIKANNTNNMYLKAGAVSIGGNAAGGAFAVGSSDSTTTATLKNASGANRVDVTGAVNVEAANTTDINHIAISGAGAGGTAIAGMASVNLITDKTEATVLNSQIGAAGDQVGSFHVKATHTLGIDSKAAAAAGALGGAGVGAGAGVNIVKARTTATVTGSGIETSGQAEVAAVSVTHIDSTAITLGVGGTAGIGGAAVVTLVGDDVKGDSSKEVGGTLSAVNDFTSGDKLKDLPVDTGTDGPQILSQGDRTELNSRASTSTSAVTDGAGAYAFRTAAEVNGTNTINAGSFDVTATDKTDTKTLVGGFGLSLGGGAGGGVAVINVKANVAANVSGTALTTTGNVNVKASADNDAGSAIEVLALAGGGGLVGLGAAVVYADITNHVDANLAGGANAGAGTVTVTAEDKTKIDVDAKGAAVGAAAAGVVISDAAKNSVVNASAGGVITASGATISASNSGMVKALGQAAAGGLLGAGSGALVSATDAATITAQSANNTTFKLGAGALRVTATATPQTEAEADGVSVSGGLSIGASSASASSSATARALLGSNTQVTAGLLDVKAIRQMGSTPSALAKAFGASGGLLLGANATVAKAESGGETTARVGDGSTLDVSGTTTVSANSQTVQNSSGLGFSGGIVAIGADFSHANSNTTTQAFLGDNVKVTGNSLQLLAASDDTNYAYAVAGSGGLLSAPFSLATTSNLSQTHVATGRGNNTDGDERKIDVGSFNASATHRANFNSWMSSTNGSLLGASGAQAFNDVKANTTTTIGAQGYVEADNIQIDAHNTVLKTALLFPGQLPGTFDITSLAWSNVAMPEWNVNSNSGGAFDAPAAGSKTTIGTNALVAVGKSAHLEQTAAGSFTLDASNDVTAIDRVKMSSGGLVSAASGKSEILAHTNNATVHVGESADMSSVGDMALGARSNADVLAQTSVDVYGLVGVEPEGDSVASFTAVNTIDIGKEAKLESLQDILISAGADSNSIANQINVSARTDVFNNTVIPANKDPVADATIDTRSQINVAAGANLGAVNNVTLAAKKGSATASGVGIGKDVYRQLAADVANAFGSLVGADEVSFETRTGNSVRTQSADVALDGEVHVGTHRKQKLVIGIDGAALSATDGISIQNTTTRAVAADILLRIRFLEDLIAKYAVDAVASPDADATIAVAGYKAEVKFLKSKLETMRTANIDGVQSGFTDSASVSPAVLAQQAVDGMTVTSGVYDLQKTGLESTNDGLTLDNEALSTANLSYQTDIDKLAANDPKRATLQAMIAANDLIILQNEADIKKNVGEIATLSGQIDGLEAQIGDLETSLLITDQNNPNYISRATTDGPAAVFVTVSDAKAELGNIFVEADTLHGEGTIDAPGDAEIRITNLGPTFVVVNNLEIPPEAGGKVYFNGIDVKDNTQINGVNGALARAKFKIFTADSQFDENGKPVTPGRPQIVIESQFNTGSTKDQADAKAAGVLVLAPDIVLQGDINNTRGLVQVVSKTGSIRVEETGHIRANTVEIKASNGDFIQSYSEGFTHVGTAPLEVVAALLKADGSPLPFPQNVDTIKRHDNDAGKGIIANGSVLIAGQYLNINGTVQSGISEWGVSVAADSKVIVNGVEKSFAEAKLYYDGLTSPVEKDAFFTVKGAKVTGLSVTEQGAREAIGVTYNAKENRLELDNVQIQGGYIGLSGQIFNTNATGGGQLKVMDGYGRIEVNNQTDLTLWVNSMDAGRGVKGEINITNATINSAGVKGILETVYTLDSVGGNRKGTVFTPDAGLEYSMMVGFDSGKVDYYRYYTNSWFDSITVATANDLYKIATVSTKNAPIVGEAESLAKNTATTTLQHPYASAVYVTTAGSEAATGLGVQTVKTSTATPELGKSWIDCNWWTLCANATHYQEYSIASVDKTTVTDKVKADYPIGIEFIGFDNGKVDIVSSGNVRINGSIYNRNGDTRVSSAKSITQTVGQSGPALVMGGNNITLSAGTGIGAAAQSLTLNVKEGGKLDATTTTGDVRVTQLVGDLNVGTIGGAGVSNVVLEAERNLLAFEAASYVQGNRVELLARNGGIGELSDTVNSPLTVRTAYTTDQTQWHNKGLIATARDNINVKNVGDVANAAQYTGDLLLISAESRTGDVRIETSGGVIDNNPFATLDTRTQTELVALWDSLALQGVKAIEKADEAVAAYKAGKENNYKLYWQMRQSQADGGAVYDPEYTYVLSQSERHVLVDSGMSSKNIDQYAQGKRDLYLELNAEVGNFTTAFDSGYQYDVSGDEAKIRQGSSWSDTQLKLSVGAGLLKNVTDTVTTIKEPNAKGKNVTLLAGTDIGSFNPSLDIDWGELKALAADKNLSEADQARLDTSKAALAAAERGDATIVSDNVIRVLQPRPVNVTIGTGVLNATATNGFALIGSEQDLRLNTVAATGDIRLKTAGSVLNAASDVTTVNVVGANIILEAGTGTVGSAAAPLRIAPFGSSGVTARAANGIWIDAMQDFYVDTMYSPGHIFLTSVGSIFDFHANESVLAPANNMLADYLTLTALGGSIGSLENPLDVGVTGRGFVTATALTPGQGVYLNGAAGENFSVGSLRSGDVISLTSVDDVLLADGAITAPGAITVVAGTDGSGSVTIGVNPAGAALDAGADLDITAANNITVTGQVVAAGMVNLASGDNIELAGGSVTGTGNTATLGAMTLVAGTDGSGSVTIGVNPAGAALDAGADLDITAANNITVTGQVVAAGMVNLASGDNIELAGGSVTGAQSVAMVAGTDGSGSIDGGGTGAVEVVSLGDLVLQAPDSIGAGAPIVARVTQKASFLSAAIYADVGTVPLSNPLSLTVADIGGGPSANVAMDVSSDTSVTFTTFNAGIAEITANTPILQVPAGNITNYAVFNMPAYTTRIDTLSRDANPGYDVNAFTLSGNFNLSAYPESVALDAFILANNPNLQVAGDPPGNVVDTVSAVLQSQKAASVAAVDGDPVEDVAGAFGVGAVRGNGSAALVNVSADWLGQLSALDERK